MSTPTGASAELGPIEKKILEICKQSETALSDAEIRKELPGDVEPLARSQAYNTLLSRGRLQIGERANRDGGRIVIYKWVSAKDAKKLAGLNAAERMVYDIIARSKEAGQTKKELRIRTNIQSTGELKAIVDRLIARSLIKEIKSIQSSNKRVYIISELDASSTHTGGPWYGDDQEFDQEFIQAMYDFALDYIAGREYVTVTEVTEHIGTSGLSNERLSNKDVEKLMYAMLYDAQIEGIHIPDASEQCFRKTISFPSAKMHVKQPCFRCPVKKHCTPGGVISQSNCVYMEDWVASAFDW